MEKRGLEQAEKEWKVVGWRRQAGADACEVGAGFCPATVLPPLTPYRPPPVRQAHGLSTSRTKGRAAIHQRKQEPVHASTGPNEAGPFEKAEPNTIQGFSDLNHENFMGFLGYCGEGHSFTVVDFLNIWSELNTFSTYMIHAVKR